MIDHLGLAVSDIDTAKAFYDAALAPLGITAMHVLDASEWGGAGKHVGYGRDGEDAFWIGDTRAATTGAHVAFTAVDEAQVQAFHAAALAFAERVRERATVIVPFPPDSNLVCVAFNPAGNRDIAGANAFARRLHDELRVAP